MRESFGGAFMLKLMLVFIVFYICFMAVAVNYAKAFRVKNQVINIIEQQQYSGNPNDDAVRLIDSYLRTAAYSYGNNEKVIKSCSDSDGYLTENGVCIVTKGDDGARYFQVITYISIDFPFFDFHFTVPIKGETKVIRY